MAPSIVASMEYIVWERQSQSHAGDMPGSHLCNISLHRLWFVRCWASLFQSSPNKFPWCQSNSLYYHQYLHESTRVLKKISASFAYVLFLLMLKGIILYQPWNWREVHPKYKNDIYNVRQFLTDYNEIFFLYWKTRMILVNTSRLEKVEEETNQISSF